jgi:hypothetical protein
MGIFQSKNKTTTIASNSERLSQLRDVIGQKIYCQCVKVSKSKGFVRFQFAQDSEIAKEYGIVKYRIFCHSTVYIFVPGSYYKLKILKVNFETEIILCKGYEEEPSQCKAQDVDMSSWNSSTLAKKSSRTESDTGQYNSDVPNLSDTISDEIIQGIFRRSLPYISDSEGGCDNNVSKPESESTGSFEKANLYPFPVNYAQKCKANSI